MADLAPTPANHGADSPGSPGSSVPAAGEPPPGSSTSVPAEEDGSEGSERSPAVKDGTTIGEATSVATAVGNAQPSGSHGERQKLGHESGEDASRQRQHGAEAESGPNGVETGRRSGASKVGSGEAGAVRSESRAGDDAVGRVVDEPSAEPVDVTAPEPGAIESAEAGRSGISKGKQAAVEPETPRGVTGSAALPSDDDAAEASTTDIPTQSPGGSAGARSDRGAAGSAGWDDESSSAALESSLEGSARDQDPAGLRATTTTPSVSEPTRTTTEPPGALPTFGAGATHPDASSVISAEHRSAVATTRESNSGTGEQDGATSSAERRGSDPADSRATGDATGGTQGSQGSHGLRGSSARAADTASRSGGVGLKQPGQTAVNSGNEIPQIERSADEDVVGNGPARQPILAEGTRNDSPSVDASPRTAVPADSVRGEASTIRRLRATALGDGSEDETTADESNTRDQPPGQARRGSRKRAAQRDLKNDEPVAAPPGLDPGVDEIMTRLGPPASRLPEDLPSPETTKLDDRTAAAVTDDAVGTNAAHRTTETSAACPQEENISAVQAATQPTRASAARERSSLRRGGTADRVGGDDVMEDEAAIAVREAALRAAAQVGGTSEGRQRGGAPPGDGAPPDAQADVSRETSAGQANAHGGEAKPGMTIGPEETPAQHAIDSDQAARDARVTFQITHGGYSKFAVAVANQKGGVGKSTTAVNLGAYLSLAGARVLVVDLDPQGNASTGLGLDHRGIEPSVYDVLMGEADAASAIRQTPVSNLDILPSTIDLAGAEVELVNALSRETRLRQALGTVRYGYDVVFIDCPPSLGLLTVNALAAADELLIPIQCEYYALEGLGQLLRNVDLVRVNLNPGLHIGGIVLTMYDGRTRLAEQVVQEVRKHFSDLVYHTVVPRSVRLSEAPGYGVPIALYDPLSRGGIAYRDLAFELADRTGLLAPTQEGAS